MTFVGALNRGTVGKDTTQAVIGINRDPCLALVSHIEIRPSQPRKA
jgi:hypothetical protein